MEELADSALKKPGELMGTVKKSYCDQLTFIRGSL